MAIYTLSERTEGLLSNLGAGLALVVRFRLLAFAGGLLALVIFTAIRLLTEGTEDLPFQVFGYYVTGEVMAVVATISRFQQAPVSVTIHGALTAAWITFLFRGGLISQWLLLWSALRLPGA